MTGAEEVGAAAAGLDSHAAAPTVPDDLETNLAKVAADVPPSWIAAMRLAARIKDTVFVPKALRGDPAAVLACVLTGEELGLGPMQSLRMVHVIDGRPSASAELMRALVNRAGHRLSVVEARQDSVTLHGERRDTGAQATVTWTMADAQRAKLTGNPSWARYPRSMLLARATSELCRQIFSDVIGGLYTPEESAAIEGHAWSPDDPGELVDPVTAKALEAPAHVDQDGVITDPEDAAWVAEARADELDQREEAEQRRIESTFDPDPEAD